jgi:hypothetical protein
MSIIPNSLTITINTSIPGHQTIKFKPNMLITSLSKDDNTVYFNPQILLNQSKINNVPKNIRVLEFFNKGLFNSLINYHGAQPNILPTLEEAKNKGIIDNNILVTLNTLFPTNGVIYIDKQSYVIVDFQWTKGDWKIDSKPLDLREIKIDKIKNPFIYNNYVTQKIKEGEKELDALPNNVKYGNNYNKNNEIPKQRLLNDDNKKQIDVSKEIKLKSKINPSIQLIEPSKPAPQIEPLKPAPQIEPLKPAPQIEPLKPAPQIETPKPAPQIETPKPAPQIEPSKPAPQIEPMPPHSDQVEEIRDEPMTLNIDLPISKKSTTFLRNYFINNNFYFMINQIYLNMNEKQRKLIQNIYLNTTGIKIIPTAVNLSKTAYDITINGNKNVSKGLRVVHNEGGGNCFFISIADAINYYNSTSQNKIIYGNYGIGNNLFTQKFLRTLVADFIIKNINEYLSISEVYMKELNTTFQDLLKQNINITDENYMNIINDIYKNNDNLLIKKPNTVPLKSTNDYYNPFKVYSKNEKDQIRNYFESSDYWADANTMNILSNILHLNIIPIINKNGYLTIANAKLKKDDINKWNRYVFLYYNNEYLHYELLSFDFISTKIIKETSLKVKQLVNRVVIFDTNNQIIPPIYILFLLFSTYYLSLDNKSKNEIIYFNDYLNVILNSFNLIIDNNNKETEIFLKIFNIYFPETYKKLNLHNKIIETQLEKQIGGLLTNSTYKSNKDISKKNQKENNLSYNITIDLEVQLGNKLSEDKLKNIDCDKGLNRLKKSFATFTGQKYVIPPAYTLLSEKYSNNENKTRKNKGVKKNKSIKYLSINK